MYAAPLIVSSVLLVLMCFLSIQATRYANNATRRQGRAKYQENCRRSINAAKKWSETRVGTPPPLISPPVIYHPKDKDFMFYVYECATRQYYQITQQNPIPTLQECIYAY